jgi:hypothetical protein
VTRRIHVVGSSPRTGTTLVAELLAGSFAIDAFSRNECSIFRAPPPGCEIFLSKNPRDVLVAAPLLRIDPQLWILHMVRDPRDVVVSRHAFAPDRYWTNLRLWKQYRRAARRAQGHPRFLTLRYEDLVSDPDAVQDAIARFLPFLARRRRFSEFEAFAKPSPQSLQALGGVRAISPASVGRWREHKPWLVAQLARHGAIDADLVALGYEPDAGWQRELAGIEPARSESFHPEHLPLRVRLARARRRRRALRRYARRMRSR